MPRTWKEITVEDNADVWDKAEPLEGALTKVESEIGPNKSKMYTVGDTKVWGSTVLDDKLMSVPVGTFVKIEYEGKLKSKKGAEYHSYKVFIDMDSVPQEQPKDKVVDVDPDEEINLSDIPF